MQTSSKATRHGRRFLILPLALLAALILPALFSAAAYADDGPVITVQPKDAQVNYPDGATFHVEVAAPEQVASWQWVASDGNSEFDLDGVSATTDTLVIPSTMQDDPDMFYCCVITDKAGKSAVSDPVRLHILNPMEDKTVLYVGDYALEPGEKLDISKTPLGKGTVSFAADGVNITLDSVQINSSGMTYGSGLTPSFGLYLVRRHSPIQKYYLHFRGDCLIDDTFYDPEYNAAGVAVNSFFACKGNEEVPTVVIDGDGKLTVKGGTNQIYSDGNIELAADIVTGVNGDYFNDGIRCNDLTVDDGVKVKLRVNGTAVHTEGDLCLNEGATLEAESSSPHVSVGPTAKNILFIVGDVKAKNAKLHLKGWADPANFVPYNAYVGVMSGISLAGGGSVIAEGAAISVELSAKHADEPYAMNFYGISGDGEDNDVILTQGATLDVRINAPEVTNAGGVSIPGFFDVEDGSRVDIDILAAGEVLAAEADRKLAVADSIVESKTKSADGGLTLGLVCGEAYISLNETGSSLHSVAKDGVAFAAGQPGDEETVKYIDGYQAKWIELAGLTRCVDPENAEINLYGIPGYGSVIRAETFFGSDKSKPAAEVLLTADILTPPVVKPAFVDVNAGDWFYEPVEWAVKKGIIKGTDETHFSPHQLCSRAQLATLLWRAAGCPAAKADCKAFTDVDVNAYYYPALNWAYEENIIKGLSPVSFGPNASITREQLAAFLYRYAQSKGQGFTGLWSFKLDFTDADKVSEWAVEPISWCVMNGIITGVGDKRLAPQGVATRAQVTTMLYRFFNQ
ncbi:MAG: S-layer homology domain-containing protein [Firmicutes bacterium]|nr:S-layer homology domain-containing protein [Bacillota bacterium]